MSKQTQSDQSDFRIMPWEDNWGDVNWVVMASGKVLSRHATWLSALAAFEWLTGDAK